MIQHFDLCETALIDGDVSIRPCDAYDAATLAQWFRDDGVDRGQLRIVGEFTIWPFMVTLRGIDAAFLQAWRTTNGAGGLEIFVAPDYRRRHIAIRALKRMARHLRSELGWEKITVEPHSDDDMAIRCFEKAGFRDLGERRDDGDHTHIILEWP
ncbi:MAG TPA: GNAT family N-acetyltransferase [Candidatus Baltobacteraceae bacterium]|nr:GNAT family N-acetyltransferase [Candidatus Baltobacteraceae bacterium]